VQWNPWVADGWTNIGGGLGVAANVLDSRRHRNAVAGIIFLSDDQDNQTGCSYGPNGRQIHRDLVPHSLRRSAGNRCAPVHAFGFGWDHDAAAMQAIAEETGGTFSFIENQAVVQDSFAKCIGGLLSVAVQEARVALECLHPGVRVRAVKSGRYESSVGSDGRAASVDVGEMYADEERCFLLFLDVPVAAEDGCVTHLIRARCTVHLPRRGDRAVGGRFRRGRRGPEAGGRGGRGAVRGGCAGAVPREGGRGPRGGAGSGGARRGSWTAGRRRPLPRLAGDSRCAALVAEQRELSARVADRREYEQTGPAFMLAGITAHAQQRASMVHLISAAAAPSPSLFGPVQTAGLGSTASPAFGAAPSCFSFGFATPAMQGMVQSSRRMRGSAAGTDGSDSIFGFSFS
jgi:hypothetical protein